MGKPKGKRAHRKIDLGEDAYVAKKQEDAAQGGAVDELPDDSLFFVDNDGGLAAGGGLAVMTRKDKARASWPHGPRNDETVCGWRDGCLQRR